MSAPLHQTERRARGRPRSTRCHEAILDATAELLEEKPYSEITMEGIAERAGVAKQTIYKWWPSRAKLAMEAWTARTQLRIVLPDTGSVEEDLRRALRATCRSLSRGTTARTVAGLMAEAQIDPEFAAQFREVYIGSRRRAVGHMLERAITRGELRPDCDVPLALDLMFGPIWYRLLIRIAPLDAAFADAILEHLLPSLRAVR